MLIIVSLTVYSFSMAEAARHSNPLAYGALEQSMDSMDHSMLKMSNDDDHQNSQSLEKKINVDKQNCCKIFCSNSALVDLCGMLDHTRTVSTRFVHSDEQLVKGELAQIHTPPVIDFVKLSQYWFHPLFRRLLQPRVYSGYT